MKERTKQVLQQAISNIDRAIEVSSSAVVGDVVRLNVCRTLNVTKDKIIVDSDGLQWIVIDFIRNERIDLQAYNHADAFEAHFIFSPLPMFLSGTPISVNDEYLQIDKRTREKTPFIWFLSPYSEDAQGRLSAIDYTANVRLFFMEEASNPNWLNNDHDKYSVNPMFELVAMFVDALDMLGEVNTIEAWSVIDRPRFGVEVANKGSQGVIIDDYLSGAELNISFALQKENCKC